MYNLGKNENGIYNIIYRDVYKSNVDDIINCLVNRVSYDVQHCGYSIQKSAALKDSINMIQYAA